MTAPNPAQLRAIEWPPETLGEEIAPAKAGMDIHDRQAIAGRLSVPASYAKGQHRCQILASGIRLELTERPGNYPAQGTGAKRFADQVFDIQKQ